MWIRKYRHVQNPHWDLISFFISIQRAQTDKTKQCPSPSATTSVPTPSPPPSLTTSQPLDAYVYATSVWYFIRGCARIYQPHEVARWFRAGRIHRATDLELYNIVTDAFCLLALSCFTIALSSAARDAARNVPPAKRAIRASPYALLTVAITGAHHAATGLHAYWQDRSPKTSTGAMLLGWTVSGGLVLMGIAVVLFGTLRKPTSMKVKT